MLPISPDIERRSLQVAASLSPDLSELFAVGNAQDAAPSSAGARPKRGSWSGVAVGLAHGTRPSSCHHGRLCVERGPDRSIYGNELPAICQPGLQTDTRVSDKFTHGVD